MPSKPPSSPPIKITASPSSMQVRIAASPEDRNSSSNAAISGSVPSISARSALRKPLPTSKLVQCPKVWPSALAIRSSSKKCSASRMMRCRLCTLPIPTTMSRRFQPLIIVGACVMLASCVSTSEPKKLPKPPPPPPPGSELSTQPWARPEKDWEGGRPSFMPGNN